MQRLFQATFWGGGIPPPPTKTQFLPTGCRIVCSKCFHSTGTLNYKISRKRSFSGQQTQVDDLPLSLKKCKFMPKCTEICLPARLMRSPKPQWGLLLGAGREGALLLGDGRPTYKVRREHTSKGRSEGSRGDGKGMGVRT